MLRLQSFSYASISPSASSSGNSLHFFLGVSHNEESHPGLRYSQFFSLSVLPTHRSDLENVIFLSGRHWEVFVAIGRAHIVEKELQRDLSRFAYLDVSFQDNPRERSGLGEPTGLKSNKIWAWESLRV